MRCGKLIGWLLLGIVLAGCSALGPLSEDYTMPTPSKSEAPEALELPDMGEAPELVNETWLNTPVPLRLMDLRGKVVLLEFWTFG
ncbi:MAG: hypothetical protein PVF85_13040 [Anaerolineales bacterium]|jgi:hypothetical protein